MVASSSATLLKTPRRIRSVVIRPKKRSTWLIQELDVGVKCMWKRRWWARQALAGGWFWGAEFSAVRGGSGALGGGGAWDGTQGRPGCGGRARLYVRDH